MSPQRRARSHRSRGFPASAASTPATSTRSTTATTSRSSRRSPAEKDSPMSEAKLNGITINYNVVGDGPAVLLTHGYSATGRMWKPQEDALKHRYRLVTWDMRGHGQTESPDDPARYSEA